MAVMASPQLEATAVDQKQAAKTASPTPEDKTSNGNAVNGHDSPSHNGLRSSPDAASKPLDDVSADKTDAPATDASKNQAQNHDAFASNKSITVDSKSPKVEKEMSPKEPEASNSETHGADDDAAPVNGSSDDATDSKPASEEKKAAVEPVEDEKIETKESDAKTDKADEEVDVEMTDGAGAETPNAPSTHSEKDAKAADDTSQPENDKPASEPSGETKPSDEIASTKADDGVPNPVDSKPAKSPAGGATTEPPNISKLVVTSQDVSTDEPDTAMTDAPLQNNKVAREREDDGTDEPAAKRAKTEPSESELEPDSGNAANEKPGGTEAAAPAESEKKPSDEVVDSDPVGDAMELDSDSWEGNALKMVPKAPNALPGSLMHPTSYDKPISEFANREIRKALGSVKKTKAGGNFKDSVAKLWPALADTYNSKVKKPMDIGLMERNLRSQVYKTIGEFKADLDLLVVNSYYFNGAVHDVTKSAVSLLESVLYKLVDTPLDEPNKAVSSQPKVSASTRHAEPRAATQPRPKPAPVPAAKPPAPAPPPPPPVEKVVHAPVQPAPAPRRDSKDDDRPKRPIHPPKKELGYDGKGSKKKKLAPDLKFCDELLKDLAKPKNQTLTWIFAKPVDEIQDGAPGYYKVIKEPMDLQTITTKLQTGQYRNADGFKSDFDLMLNNCFTFNPAGTDVHALARNLETYFQEKWSGIDAYVSKHASRAPARRASASSPTGALRDESDDEGPPSEPEPEVSAAHLDQIRELKKKIDAVDASITKHKEQYTEEVANSSDPSDTSKLDILMSIIQMLNKDLGDKKKKLAELEASVPAPKSKPAAKSKKATAAGSGTGQKKASGGGKKAGGGGGKKGSGRRVMSTIEKEAIASGINELDGTYIEQAVAIIKKDTNQEENGDGELELEIEQLSTEALNKLYDIMCVGIKGFRANVESMVKNAQASAPPPASAPAAGIAGRGQKPKKNKPMGKCEQERKLEHLEKLKQQYLAKGRQGSGSQEPPAANEVSAQQAADEDDSDVSSEED